MSLASIHPVDAVVQLTQQMLAAATDHAWDQLAILQEERDRQVAQGTLDWSSEALQEVIRLNTLVAGHVQQARDQSADLCTQARERTRAITAYTA